MRESDLTRANQQACPPAGARRGHHGGVGIVSLVLAACTSPAGSKRRARPGRSGGAAARPPPPAGPKVTITPGTGARTPSRPWHHGHRRRRQDQRRDRQGRRQQGRAAPRTDAKTRGTPSGRCTPDTRYKVTAAATDSAGHKNHADQLVPHARPGRDLLATQIFEGSTRPTASACRSCSCSARRSRTRPRSRRRCRSSTSKPVVGAWYWDGDQTLNFRPRDYWPPHTKVSFTGTWTAGDRPRRVRDRQADPGLQIGRSLIVVASTAAHQKRFYWKGKLSATWPDSAPACRVTTPPTAPT